MRYSVIVLLLAITACSAQQNKATPANSIDAIRAAIVAKNFGEAAQLARDAVKVTPNDPAVRYQQARAEALAGNEGAALDALDAAVRAGLPNVGQALADPAFNSMRESEKFSALLARASPATPTGPVNGLTAGDGADKVSIGTDATGREVIKAGDVTLNADF